MASIKMYTATWCSDCRNAKRYLLQKNVEFGANVQVLGSGGGFTSKALPGFLRTLVTPYQWLGMWRSSENRSIHISETLFESEQDQPLTSEQVDKLQEFENELISLDKYKGGHSEYLTVVTHSDEFTGAVALFKASFGGDSLITRLDLAAYIRDVPREICRILRDDVKPNRYELGRKGQELRCKIGGGLPCPRPAAVSGKKLWTNIGGGWRHALRITPNNDSSFQEGLLATVPQMMAYLHLRHGLVNSVLSSPVAEFELPLTSLGLNDKDGATVIRRGTKLLGPPEGFSHVGRNVKIAVLFPRDSEWTKEQLFWA